MRKKFALVALVIILAIVNWSIVGKEKQLVDGKIVYLELAPVDPRSLMQGDYMALHFRIADEIHESLRKIGESKPWLHNVMVADGFVVVTLDDKGVGVFKELYQNTPLSDDELIMRYRIRNGAIKFATNAYFFEEGHGKYYRPARYGQFRVDDKGELLLAAMYDKEMLKLEPKD